MSNGKQYVLSFTTLFYNKKGYVLMFNRHKNVHHLDKFPMAFNPWSRYDALVMNDMKMGTKVKQATGVLSVVSDFKTIFEGSDVDLNQGVVFYLSDLNKELVNIFKSPNGVLLHDDGGRKIFHEQLANVIEKVNAKLFKSAISSPLLLKSIKIYDNGQELPSVVDTYPVNSGEIGIYDLFDLIGLEADDKDLELVRILPDFGYNQVLELSDKLFKGSEISSTERLMKLLYGEKSVDVAKANFVKSVFISLLDVVSNGLKIDVVYNSPTEVRFDAASVVEVINLDELEQSINMKKVSHINYVTDFVKSPDVYVSNLDRFDRSVNIKKNIGFDDYGVRSSELTRYFDLPIANLNFSVKTVVNSIFDKFSMMKLKEIVGVVSSVQSVVTKTKLGNIQKTPSSHRLLTVYNNESINTGFVEGSNQVVGDLEELQEFDYFSLIDYGEVECACAILYLMTVAGNVEIDLANLSFIGDVHAFNSSTNVIGNVDAIEQKDVSIVVSGFGVDGSVDVELEFGDLSDIDRSVELFIDDIDISSSSHELDVYVDGPSLFTNKGLDTVVEVIGLDGMSYSGKGVSVLLSDFEYGLTGGGIDVVEEQLSLMSSGESGVEVSFHNFDYGKPQQSGKDVTVYNYSEFGFGVDTKEFVYLDGIQAHITSRGFEVEQEEVEFVESSKKAKDVYIDSLDLSDITEVDEYVGLERSVLSQVLDSYYDVHSDGVVLSSVFDGVFDVDVEDVSSAVVEDVSIDSEIFDSIGWFTKADSANDVQIVQGEYGIGNEFDVESVLGDNHESGISKDSSVSVEIERLVDSINGYELFEVMLLEIDSSVDTNDTVDVSVDDTVGGQLESGSVLVSSEDIVSAVGGQDKDVELNGVESFEFNVVGKDVELNHTFLSVGSGWSVDTYYQDYSLGNYVKANIDVFVGNFDLGLSDSSVDVVFNELYNRAGVLKGVVDTVVGELVAGDSGQGLIDIFVETLELSNDGNALLDVVTEFDAVVEKGKGSVDVSIESVDVADASEVTVTVVTDGWTSVKGTDNDFDVVVDRVESSLLGVGASIDVVFEYQDEFKPSVDSYDIVSESHDKAIPSIKGYDTIIEYQDDAVPGADGYDVHIEIHSESLQSNQGYDTVIELHDEAIPSIESYDVSVEFSNDVAPSIESYDAYLENYVGANYDASIDVSVETDISADSGDGHIESTIESVENAVGTETFKDVVVSDFDQADRGRSRYMGIIEDEEAEPGGSHYMVVHDDEEADSTSSHYMLMYEDEEAIQGGSTIMLIEDEATSIKSSISGMTIDEDDDLATRDVINEFDIFVDEEANIVPDVYNMGIEEDRTGMREREFNFTIEDDDTGVGLLPPNPPWDEPKPNNKVWLIMGKPFPAWNNWNPKKTR